MKNSERCFIPDISIHKLKLIKSKDGLNRNMKSFLPSYLVCNFKNGSLLPLLEFFK